MDPNPRGAGPRCPAALSTTALLDCIQRPCRRLGMPPASTRAESLRPCNGTRQGQARGCPEWSSTATSSEPRSRLIRQPRCGRSSTRSSLSRCQGPGSRASCARRRRSQGLASRDARRRRQALRGAAASLGDVADRPCPLRTRRRPQGDCPRPTQLGLPPTPTQPHTRFGPSEGHPDRRRRRAALGG